MNILLIKENIIVNNTVVQIMQYLHSEDPLFEHFVIYMYFPR